MVPEQNVVECESCAYDNPSWGLIQIPFDDDVENVEAMLSADPLTVPCANCGNPVACVPAIAFVDATNLVASVLAVNEQGLALAEELGRTGEGWNFSVHQTPEDQARAVHAHVSYLAEEGKRLSARLFAATQKSSDASGLIITELAKQEPLPSRQMLNSLVLLGGDGKEMATAVTPFIALWHSFLALRGQEDARQRLDELVPPSLVSERIGFLVGFGMSLGATQFPSPDGRIKPDTRMPLELGVAILLAAAWASDRCGVEFVEPGPAVWAECVVNWFDKYPEAIASLGPTDFLCRTVDNVQVANIVTMKLLRGPGNSALIEMIEQAGLFGGIDFADHSNRIIEMAKGPT